MARKFNLQEARKKIKRVFKYLGELNRIKTPPDIEISQYKWLFWLDRNLSTTMGHSTGLIREQCPVW